MRNELFDDAEERFEAVVSGGLSPSCAELVERLDVDWFRCGLLLMAELEELAEAIGCWYGEALGTASRLRPLLRFVVGAGAALSGDRIGDRLGLEPLYVDARVSSAWSCWESSLRRLAATKGVAELSTSFSSWSCTVKWPCSE